MPLPIFSRMSGVSCRLALPESHNCASVTRVAIETFSEVHQKATALLDERHPDSCLNGEQSSKELPTLEVSLHSVAISWCDAPCRNESR